MVGALNFGTGICEGEGCGSVLGLGRGDAARGGDIMFLAGECVRLAGDAPRSAGEGARLIIGLRGEEYAKKKVA